MNALEKFLEDREKEYAREHGYAQFSFENGVYVSPRVTYGDLRAFAKEHRELEAENVELKKRLGIDTESCDGPGGGDKIDWLEESIRQLRFQIENWELHEKGMEAKTKSLLESLKKREGERCENCAHNKQLSSFKPDTHIHCSELKENMPKVAWCTSYTAKPKVRKMPLSLAKEVAARIWCDPAMSKIEMDCDLAIKIAEILTTVKGTWEEK